MSDPRWLGWTWRAHFDELLLRINAGNWLSVAGTLAKMTSYAVEQAVKKNK